MLRHDGRGGASAHIKAIAPPIPTSKESYTCTCLRCAGESTDHHSNGIPIERYHCIVRWGNCYENCTNVYGSWHMQAQMCVAGWEAPRNIHENSAHAGALYTCTCTGIHDT